MEQKIPFGQRLLNAFSLKGSYSLPPEYFENSTSYGHKFKFKLLNGFFGYDVGGKMTSLRYMKAFKESPLVYMIVNKLATTTAQIKQIAVNPQDKTQEIENSRLLEFLANPNPSQSETEFRESIYQSLALTGNAFLYRTDTLGLTGSFTVEVWNAGQVDILTTDGGLVSGYQYQDSFDNEITVTAGELDRVLHIKTSNVAQYKDTAAHLGISPLEASWLIVKSSDEKFNAEASIFKNRGIIGILTNSSDVPLLPQERQRLQDEFDEEVGGSDRFNKIKISTTKLNYIQTGMSPTDLKLLEGIVSSLRMLCAVYGLPSVLFNDNENSTYNNVREAKITAYNDAYLPMCESVNDKLSPWLSKALGVNEFLMPDVTQIEVLKNTTNKIMTALNSLEPTVARTVAIALRVNDVLEMLGAEPLEEGGDQLLTSGNNQSTTNGNESE